MGRVCICSNLCARKSSQRVAPNSSPSGGPAPASALDGIGLLEAIVCETQTEALYAVVVGSGINALRHKNSVKNPQSIKNFLPRESAVMGELLRSHEDAGLSSGVMLRLREVFGGLAAARGGAARFFAAAKLAGSHAAAIDPSSFAAHWSGLCEQTIETLRALDTETIGRVPDYYLENSSTLMKMLASVAAGGQPCIDAAGEIVLPDLPQRRRTARRSLLQQVTLRHRGKNTLVIAKDISATGLGLDRVPELQLEELVQIEMTGGRRLMGMVVWIKGVTAGIRLGKPLPPNDPLLGG